MKICMPHWKELAAAIDERGLGKFVASNGAELKERLQAQLGTPAEEKAAGFEPLANANFAIWNNALGLGGLYLMGTDEQGNPFCPICEAVKNGVHDSAWWINSAADEQLERARELGLLPPASVQ
jgi:hypothetical protein